MQTVQHYLTRLSSLSYQNLKIRSVFIVICGSFLIALGAQTTIPLQPVPVTLQSFVALFIGILLGPKLGVQAVMLYLFEGVCGLPVFANFSFGLAHLAGPTGGYLCGLVFAVMLTGYLLQRTWAHNKFAIFFAALAGTVVLFVPGYLVLAMYVGFKNAFLVGVKPFYFIELTKILIFTFMAPLFWKRND